MIINMKTMRHQLSLNFSHDQTEVKRMIMRNLPINNDCNVLQPYIYYHQDTVNEKSVAFTAHKFKPNILMINDGDRYEYFSRSSIYIMIKVIRATTHKLTKLQAIKTHIFTCRGEICHYWNKPYQFEIFPLFKQGQNVQLPTIISRQMLQSKQTVRLDNFSSQKSQEIANFIHKFSSINPKTVRTHAIIGSGLFLQGKFKQASNQFSKARSIDKNVEFVIQISICLIQLGNYFQGIKLLEKQLESNKNNGLLYHNLAVCHYLIGQLKTSIGYFYKSYQINPYISEEFRLNAEELYIKQDYHNAIPFFIKLLFVKQTKKQTLLKLKYCYIMSDKTSQAIEFYSYLQQIESQNIEARISLGLLYFQTGRILEAKPILQILTKLVTQHDFTINLYLGTIYIQQSNNQAALLCLNKCYQMDSNNSMLLGCLASVNLKLKEYEKAQVFSYKALEQDENNSIAWFNLGLVNLERKNIEHALVNMKKALQVDQDNLLACTKIAQISHILGQEGESAKYIQRALQIQKRTSRSE